jgi:hypothetical protein
MLALAENVYIILPRPHFEASQTCLSWPNMHWAQYTGMPFQPSLMCACMAGAYLSETHLRVLQSKGRPWPFPLTLE